MPDQHQPVDLERMKALSLQLRMRHAQARKQQALHSGWGVMEEGANGILALVAELQAAIDELVGYESSLEDASQRLANRNDEIKRLQGVLNQVGVIQRKKNRDVLLALGQMSGNPNEHYIPPVTLAKRTREAEDSVQQLTAELQAARADAARIEAMKLGEQEFAGFLRVGQSLVDKDVEIKRLRTFIQTDYDQYEEHHPYARELLRTYPWLADAAVAEAE